MISSTLTVKYPSVQSEQRGLSRASYISIALLLVCACAQALDPSRTITQYHHFSWTRQENRLPGTLTALAQTRDGTLWIGTESGLLRFDGVRFTPWQPPAGQPLLSESIGALMAATDGTLWIGTHERLAHWVNNKLVIYQTGQSPPRAAPGAILEAADHTVWVGLVGNHAGGLCRIEENHLNCPDAALPGPGVSALLQDHSSNLWVGSVGALSYWNHSSSQAYPLQTATDRVSSIIEDRSGQICLTTRSIGGLLCLKGGKLVPGPIMPAGQPFRPVTLLLDRDGGIWIGTFGQGLIHLHDGRADRFTRADGLSSDVVYALLEDREGNIWSATADGLDRFREFAVNTLSKREGLAQDLVTSVAASHSGGLWVGTPGGLNRVLGNNISVLDRRNGLPSASISGLFEESGGGLWVITSGGLSYLDGKRFRSMDQSLPRRIRSITAAAEDHNHDLWFSDPEQGLVRFRDRRFAEIVPWSQFRNKQARSMEAGLHDGELWVGFSGGGLAHWKQGHIARWYGPEDGLPSGTVADLHLARDGSLWIATENGLSRLSQRHIATLGKANGLPCENIQAMLEDDEGAIWLNTTCGLIRVAAQELTAWSADPRRQIRPAVYDASDGMHTHSGGLGYSRHAAKSIDGLLWFSVVDGVAGIDPKHLPKNELAPPVAIQRIIADQKDYLAESQPRLPPKTKSLEIDYTAFSFVAPDRVRFRYRIERMESEWHEAGDLRRATYTNLPPGTYQFHVVASNNDGIWNSTGASFYFSVLPAYYQTVWFKLSCTAAAFLLLWGLYRLRLRQLAAQMKLRFEERLAERTRIANELHDDLLQNIAGFGLQLDGLSKIAADPVRARERIRDLREQAEQWLHDSRETVWDIRTPSFEDHGFLDALRDTAERIAQGKAVQLELTVTGDRRPLPPHLAGQLLRITREAIRNAVRHSNARIIRLQVAYLDHNMLRVMIIDDGCGFDLEHGLRKMKHWGLAAMQERGRTIGAELKINTAPGEGTTIQIKVSTDPGSQ